MSENKLIKYLRKEFKVPSGTQHLTPILLSDSKGFSLQKQASNVVEQSIKLWCKSGRNSRQGLEWLQENLATQIGRIDNISLYVWLGTCDLTTYNKKCIALGSENKENIEQIVTNFKEISSLFTRYSGCKLTFLETPLEQRVKELERSNEILRKHSNLLNVAEPTNQTVNKDSSQAPSQNQNVQTNSSNIQLLGNIQDRVSNFILRQIDDQLVKLEDSFIKSSQSPSYQGTSLSPDQSQTSEFQQQIPPQFNVNHQHLTMNPTCIPPNRMNTINSSTDTSRSRSNEIGVNRTLSGQTIYYSPPSYMTPKYQANVPPGIQAVSTNNQKIPYMHPHYNSTLPSTVQNKICVEPHPLTHHNQHTWQGSQQNSNNQNILRKEHFLGHSQPQYSRP
ncbi:unnamed protein product [Mytilus edulis]|uniref:Uncharacterized protein n=1 Tax=Mytilus edulis TaxID=6550 RepID=A0A8S3QE01_MYTED|nr:unnamed protein product [Mytilus edulis]